MAVKMTGLEFKAFYFDEKYWPVGSWHEETTIIIDGVNLEELEESDAAKISDTSAVRVEGGFVIRGQDDHEGLPFEAFIRRWRKTQNTETFLVTVSKDQAESLKAMIKLKGGSIK